MEQTPVKPEQPQRPNGWRRTLGSLLLLTTLFLTSCQAALQMFTQ